MRIIETNEAAAAEVLDAMRTKLAVSAGATTPDASGRTAEIFGDALSPQEVTARIIEDVRREGDAAVFRYTKAFDGFDLSADNLRVSAAEVAEAGKAVSTDFVRAAEAAIANVRRFQESLLSKPPAEVTTGGRVTGLRLVPVRRVGAHVPGFSAPLPSSVIMNCVPAQVAGVKEIAVATPPRKSGEVAAETLVCCEMLGITEIYRAAGVQMLAAMALGTASVAKVDMIVGPGRLETQLAKKMLLGDVAIDMLAGPSEVLVLADDSARPDVVAADILSQAEHAPAAAFLVTPSRKLADAVVAEIARQLKTLARRDRTAEVLREYALAVVTATMDEAIEIANDLAPEHLQMTTADDDAALAKIRNAGTVFVGAWTPIAAGDYTAGPSHTLPTGGTAKFSSGLSANDFLRQMSVVRYDEQALRADAEDITTLAESEGLTAHAESVRVRFRKKQD